MKSTDCVPLKRCFFQVGRTNWVSGSKSNAKMTAFMEHIDMNRPPIFKLHQYIDSTRWYPSITKWMLVSTVL